MMLLEPQAEISILTLALSDKVPNHISHWNKQIWLKFLCWCILPHGPGRLKYCLGSVFQAKPWELHQINMYCTQVNVGQLCHKLSLVLVCWAGGRGSGQGKGCSGWQIIYPVWFCMYVIKNWIMIVFFTQKILSSVMSVLKWNFIDLVEMHCSYQIGRPLEVVSCLYHP